MSTENEQKKLPVVVDLSIASLIAGLMFVTNIQPSSASQGLFTDASGISNEKQLFGQENTEGITMNLKLTPSKINSLRNRNDNTYFNHLSAIANNVATQLPNSSNKTQIANDIAQQIISDILTCIDTKNPTTNIQNTHSINYSNGNTLYLNTNVFDMRMDANGNINITIWAYPQWATQYNS